MKKKSRNLKKNDLKHYETYTPMTAIERKALRNWVYDGNSVHDNPYHAVNEETGVAIDFLDIYRAEQHDSSDNEIPWDEHSTCLASIKNLKRTVRDLRHTLFCLWTFLDHEEMAYDALEYIKHVSKDNPFFNLASEKPEWLS